LISIYLYLYISISISPCSLWKTANKNSENRQDILSKYFQVPLVLCFWFCYPDWTFSRSHCLAKETVAKHGLQLTIMIRAWWCDDVIRSRARSPLRQNDDKIAITAAWLQFINLVLFFVFCLFFVHLIDLIIKVLKRALRFFYRFRSPKKLASWRSPRTPLSGERAVVRRLFLAPQLQFEFVARSVRYDSVRNSHSHSNSRVSTHQVPNECWVI